MLFRSPVGIALTIVRNDAQGESAKAVLESLELAGSAEGLTQLFSNDSVFLDPGLKEATDPVDT